MFYSYFWDEFDYFIIIGKPQKKMKIAKNNCSKDKNIAYSSFVQKNVRADTKVISNYPLQKSPIFDLSSF